MRLPLLWGRWTLDNVRRHSLIEAGGTKTHGGLSVHVDTHKLVRRICSEDIKQCPDLKTLILKVGADKAQGHKGQSLVSMCVSSNPVVKAFSNSSAESKLLCIYEGAGDDAESICTYAAAGIPSALITKT